MWKPQGIYSQYLIHQPTLFFGEKSIDGLIGITGATISVIHGKTIGESLIEWIKISFKKKKVHFIERSWKDEPDFESLKDTISQLEMQKPDIIIAIGGGSVIDGTKLCRLFYEYPAFEVGITRISQLEFSTKFIAIPTTIGSGAEISSAAVFFNRNKNRKDMLVSVDLLPEIVVFNPRLVADSSYRLIAASGLDAMAHIIEGYVSNVDNFICDILAETGLRILVEELDKEEINFERLQYAGYIGGVVQNHCIVGAAHGIAHQISNDFSHGEGIALLLGATIKANSTYEEISLRYEKLMKQAGMNNINELCDLIDLVLKKSGIINRKEEMICLLKNKLKDDNFIENIVNDQGAKGNPVVISREFLELLIGEI